ncbi:helix-turn-helix domain-containing protein [Streptomyces sanglieri]|uniref:Helix-turn-helix domain-containing protein n=1 Tax=Streptomyces sanglieri TaxID=193460 RepID=A0ABW2X5D5_9ACTN
MLRHAIAPSARYTKASHDVIRHPRLNSDAKILLLHVQSLPGSTTFKPLSELAQKLGIKGRAYQKAKQQLVENGYVHEWRSQSGGGRWLTEQLVANTALTGEQASHVRETPPATPHAAPPVAAPPSTHSPTVGVPTARTAGGYEPVEDNSDKTTPHPPSEPSEASEPERPASTADPTLLARAERVLLSLRHSRRELHLGVREAAKLAVEAVKWLERGLSESDLRQALLAERPKDGVRSAVGFLRYRLVQKLPEPRTTPELFEPARPRELIECQGPGKKHTFRPLLDETECTPCRLIAVNTMYSEAPSPAPEPLPWRERFARINTTPTAAPGVG